MPSDQNTTGVPAGATSGTPSTGTNPIDSDKKSLQVSDIGDIFMQKNSENVYNKDFLAVSASDIDLLSTNENINDAGSASTTGTDELPSIDFSNLEDATMSDEQPDIDAKNNNLDLSGIETGDANNAGEDTSDAGEDTSDAGEDTSDAGDSTQIGDNTDKTSPQNTDIEDGSPDNMIQEVQTTELEDIVLDDSVIETPVTNGNTGPTDSPITEEKTGEEISLPEAEDVSLPEAEDVSLPETEQEPKDNDNIKDAHSSNADALSLDLDALDEISVPESSTININEGIANVDNRISADSSESTQSLIDPSIIPNLDDIGEDISDEVVANDKVVANDEHETHEEAPSTTEEQPNGEHPSSENTIKENVDMQYDMTQSEPTASDEDMMQDGIADTNTPSADPEPDTSVSEEEHEETDSETDSEIDNVANEVSQSSNENTVVGMLTSNITYPDDSTQSIVDNDSVEHTFSQTQDLDVLDPQLANSIEGKLHAVANLADHIEEGIDLDSLVGENSDAHTSLENSLNANTINNAKQADSTTKDAASPSAHKNKKSLKIALFGLGVVAAIGAGFFAYKTVNESNISLNGVETSTGEIIHDTASQATGDTILDTNDNDTIIDGGDTSNNTTGTDDTIATGGQDDNSDSDTIDDDAVPAGMSHADIVAGGKLVMSKAKGVLIQATIAKNGGIRLSAFSLQKDAEDFVQSLENTTDMTTLSDKEQELTVLTSRLLSLDAQLNGNK